MYKKITRFCGLFFHIFFAGASKIFPLAGNWFLLFATRKKRKKQQQQIK